MTADTDVRTLPAPGSTMERIAEASENETGGQEPREAAAPDTSSADEPTLREVTKPADLPDWIQQDHYVGEVHYVSVSSFPKVETDEARADAWRLAQEEIVEDFHANYPDAADWEPPVDLVSRESVVVDEFRETRDMNITGNFSSPMQIVHYRVKLTPETREIVHNAYREQVARARLEQVGVGVGILTVLTGGLALLLRRPHRHQAKAT